MPALARTIASGPASLHKVTILQGEQHVSTSSDVMISTLLGSCVAACLYDLDREVGGMNHFLLPGEKGRSDVEAMHFGVHAMELLVNGLLASGARRESIQGKLFGGAQMLDGLADVGRQNSDFALAFLKAEDIRYMGGSLGGRAARRVQFWPASGRARQLITAQGHEAVAAEERLRTSSAALNGRCGGDVELF